MVFDRTKRRTTGAQKSGRAAAVVTRVLNATAHELGRVGYEALSFENVAERSGVHKTTIYRRWPSRARLVEEALTTLMVSEQIPDCGNLTSDLTRLLRDIAQFADSPMGRGITRMIQTERYHPELVSVLRKIRKRRRDTYLRVLARAEERRELPTTADRELLLDVLIGSVMSRLVGRGEAVTVPWIRRLIGLVLDGAAPQHRAR
jgi:AcrR family transcriptional regulator